MIEVSNVTFSYNKNFQLIDNLSFKVEEASLFGFLGANGAGKTTTIRLLLGLLQPSGGEVVINHCPVKKNGTKGKQQIGVLVETPAIYDHLTGEENLRLQTLYYKVENNRIEKVLEMVGLTAASNRKAGLYSLGMKQRLGLALSLLHDPEILILDEPLNGLDPKGISEIRTLLMTLQQEEGKTIFLSSHLLGEIETTCDSICIIDQGKSVYTGSIEGLRRSFKNAITYSLTTDAPLKTLGYIRSGMSPKLNTEGTKCLFQTMDKEYVADLVQELTSAEIRIYEIATQETNLESLYLKLTNPYYNVQ
jgi:lantibiotic transport system ATP-binding protein